MPSKDRVRRNKKKDMNKCYYETNKDAILSDRKEKYDKEKRSERHNDDYYRNVLASRIKSAESTKVHYHKDVDESRVKSAERVRDHYHKDLEKSRAESAQTTKKHYLVHIDELCKKAKHRYLLRPPSDSDVKSYVDNLIEALLQQKETCCSILKKFLEVYTSTAEAMSPAVKEKTSCRLVSKKMVHEALSTRKSNIGILLKTLRKINAIQISEDDLLEGFHTSSSEPYYYDTGYKSSAPKEVTTVDRDKRCLVSKGKCLEPDECVLYDTAIPVDDKGRCVLSEQVDEQTTSDGHPKSWKCCKLCKTLINEEINEILNIKRVFERPLEEVRAFLHEIDSGCEHGHYTKVIQAESDSNKDGQHVVTTHKEKELLGHPIQCTNGMCVSPLRLLRQAAVHHPVIRNLLVNIYIAKASSKLIDQIDTGLCSGNVEGVKEALKCKKLSELLVNNPPGHEFSEPSSTPFCDKDTEASLQVKYADIICEYEKKLKDDPEFACCSCERLQFRKNVTMFKFHDEKFNSDIWLDLKAYLIQNDPNMAEKSLYVCTYCRPILNSNKMPSRCVLNGLYTIPVPDELAKLNTLETQLIQRAKCFQTVVRLGTYTGKVPIYNALKAAKGTMFFLPLDLQNTLERLDEAGYTSESTVNNLVGLPDPEIYIIIDSRPTKDKIVWQSLVNVPRVKLAAQKLRDTNWLYGSIDIACVDDAARKTIGAARAMETVDAAKKTMDIVDDASSRILEKASEEEVAGLQAYTVRSMDQNLPTGKDIEHYKMLTVHELPMDNRLHFLDVLCFPTLFPDGHFGEFHPRAEKLTFTEYVKSRLLNKDSRFRKNAEFVFFYLWQKELRELSAGIYNVLSSCGRRDVTVKQFLDNIDRSDISTEASLLTVFQSVRGTKQFWYLKKSDVMAMIREYGSPTLFLTFSCAEYDSPEIEHYLRKMNDVPLKYPIARLCTEDPISVSRKFSQKFHDFFTTVIANGKVLGKVTHFFWKKEYQGRGAPHYHVILWIEDAPVIGRDAPEDVLKWIKSKITCKIPDEKTNPELYRLVTKYQLHKCSNYCKRKRKYGTAYITKCKFGFPREVSEEGDLKSVDDSLKSKSKIYALPRSENEVRVNDYNPILLLLWKANMDVQFISESSLALAQYVTGYITKAEKSHMQEVWEEISDDDPLYKRLFKFGVKSLRTRECGLYEASDLLLGDHLCEKSETVQFVSTDMPHKRRRRVKKHKELREMLQIDPDCNRLFEQNLLDDFYPKRPEALKDVCLYDFVKWYVKCGTDDSGNRQYRKLMKPKIVNHKLFDPNKPEQREDYFYTLLLLFVPFTVESDLVKEGQTVECAFNEFLETCGSLRDHHESLKRMLEAQSKVKQIDEAQKKEDGQPDPEVDDNDEEEGVKLVGEAEAAMHDVHDMEDNASDHLDLEQRINMLNDDQKRVFDMILKYLNHQHQHDAAKCNCKDLKPLHMFVSGVGGTGKSFLIETIRSLVKHIWKDDLCNDTTCAVAAPTGLAAHNVGGVTVHRLFQLPIEHEGKTAGYWSLSKDAQKIMRTNLHGLKLIIIDEVSMLSSLNLAYIHLRLQEIFGGTEWFGGVNMLFVGDILQLPPVTGDPVFSKLNNKLVVTRLGCMTAVNIWKETIVYDELTINERQKKDSKYVQILDEIRRGCLSEDTAKCLTERIIAGKIIDKFKELCEKNYFPVCLFPTRKACNDFNSEMLSTLDTTISKLMCVDEIDETVGSRKWDKTAAKKLEMLNKDCNMTAGLEAELLIAVGARVMLRRNIDTKHGLVNGALGTVTSIGAHTVMVKFDHIEEPYPVERVRSKFLLMKNFYVYRKQFPLTMAYAITVHKCQGLSLDCAIVDLSNKVFCAGMAYVAVSRVRSLNGLYVTSFDPASIIVCNNCLKEVNRLRSSFRSDLPLYEITKQKKPPVKRKLDDGSGEFAPPPKKAPSKGKVKKRPCTSDNVVQTDSKKTKCTPSTSSRSHDADCVIAGVHRPAVPQTEWTDYRYYPIDAEWQRQKCEQLGLRFVLPFHRQDGSPDLILTRPDLRSIKKISGDGNCLFRAMSYIITGSEDQHLEIRRAIVAHMLSIPELLCGLGADGRANYLEHYNGGYSSVEDYLERTGMAHSGTWGTDLEMSLLSHLLQTVVYSYTRRGEYWIACFGRSIDKTLPEDVSVKSMYIYHTGNHFEVITAIRRR